MFENYKGQIFSMFKWHEVHIEASLLPLLRYIHKQTTKLSNSLTIILIHLLITLMLEVAICFNHAEPSCGSKYIRMKTVCIAYE